MSMLQTGIDSLNRLFDMSWYFEWGRSQFRVPTFKSVESFIVIKT